MDAPIEGSGRGPRHQRRSRGTFQALRSSASTSRRGRGGKIDPVIGMPRSAVSSGAVAAAKNNLLIGEPGVGEDRSGEGPGTADRRRDVPESLRGKTA